MIISQILKLTGVAMLFCIVTCKNRETQPSAINSLPHFKMTLPDSSTEVCSWDGKELWPSLFIYFDPDCEHCKQTIEAILKQITRLNEVNIYMLCLCSFQKLREFEKHHQLKKYDNLILAKDTELTYAYKYQGHSVPMIVVYNSDRRIVSQFRDSTTIDAIAKALKL